MNPIIDLTNLIPRDPSLPSHTSMDKAWIQQQSITILPVFIKDSDPVIEGAIGFHLKTKPDEKGVLPIILNLHIPLAEIRPDLRPTYGIIYKTNNGSSVPVTNTDAITVIAELDLISAKLISASISLLNDAEIPEESPLHQLLPDAIVQSLPVWQNSQLWLILKILAGDQVRRENSAEDISLQEMEQLAANLSSIKTTNIFRKLLALAMGPVIKASIRHARNKQVARARAAKALPATSAASLDKEWLSILLSHPDRSVRTAAIDHIGRQRKL